MVVSITRKKNPVLRCLNLILKSLTIISVPPLEPDQRRIIPTPIPAKAPPTIETRNGSEI